MSRVIQVFEFEMLTLSKDDQGRFLNSNELEKLYEFNDKNNSVYFTGIRNGVKFKNYVGVIQIGSLTIEILPKTDKRILNREEFTVWHTVLLNMLRICKHVNIDSVSEANIKRKHNSILDLYFEMFVKEVQHLVRKGLIKKYRRNPGNVRVIKGRIDFSKNLKLNLIHNERFYTDHQVYDYNHVLNKILLKCLNILKVLSRDSVLVDKINKLLMTFPELDEIKISNDQINLLNINRKTQSYQKAIEIARMILFNYSPDIKTGDENMLAILFDMNKLWEQYIFRMLLKTNSKQIEIKSQEKQLFWENRQVSPDLIIRKKNSENTDIYIIDTKWKILDSDNPKPNDDDLKQMYVYNMYYDAKKSMLLYPDSKNRSEIFGNFWKGRDTSIKNQCKVGFINILNNDSTLNYSIGEEILKKLDY